MGARSPRFSPSKRRPFTDRDRNYIRLAIPPALGDFAISRARRGVGEVETLSGRYHTTRTRSKGQVPIRNNGNATPPRTTTTFHWAHPITTVSTSHSRLKRRRRKRIRQTEKKQNKREKKNTNKKKQLNVPTSDGRQSRIKISIKFLG